MTIIYTLPSTKQPITAHEYTERLHRTKDTNRQETQQDWLKSNLNANFVDIKRKEKKLKRIKKQKNDNEVFHQSSLAVAIEWNCEKLQLNFRNPLELDATYRVVGAFFF